MYNSNLPLNYYGEDGVIGEPKKQKKTMPFIHDTTILVPHFKTGKMTAYCIHQILKHKGNNDVHIIVIDNSEGEGIDYLAAIVSQ